MWALRLLLVIVGLAGVVSCASLDSEPDSRGSVFEGGVFGDLRARKPKPVANEPQGLIPVGGGGSGRSQIFGPGAYAADGTAAAGATTGAGSPAAAAGETTGSSQPDAYRLNFDNAEIRDVVHAVLGEALGLNYTISPDVAGTTSISSARPVGRNELLSTLETVLSSQGFSLTKSGGVYRVGPLLPSAGAVDVGRRSSPGYGVSIVPLRFVSVQAISRLLGGFVTDAESLRIDRTKNALVISGPGPKREEVVQTVLSFDEDWMANQSVAILELKRAQPDAVVSELERVFDSGANGNANGAIQFKPIKRLRAVLAVSSNQTLIRRAETWVRRLDQENADGEGNVFIYRAKYRDSKELAKIVGTLFGVSADTSLTTGGQQGAAGGSSGSSGSPISGTTGGDGTSGDGSGTSQTTDPSQTGETPIDNVTGAGEDTSGGDQSGTATSDSASPDVIDLTRQGNEGANTAIRISADPTNNSVVVFADGDTFRKIQATLRELDVPPLQVAIQATIAEVKLNTTLQYGVKYYFQSGDAGVNFQNSEASALTRTLPGFNFLLGSASDPDLIISALDKVTDVEILSSPSLVVMENQTANLQVGNSVPIQVSQRTSNDTSNAVTVNEIEYRNTGIILKVTPRIGENGAVTMSIDQEISNVADQSNKLGPTFSQRKVSSRISVISGQTVVLAGLITSSKDNGRTGLPLVNRIPILRDATGDTSKKGERTELVVLIKPVVIHDGEDAQTVAEDLRSRLWSIGQRERQSP